MPKALLLSIVLIFLFLQANSQDNLEDFIRSAKLNNPQLQDFQNRVQIGELESERLISQYKRPQIGLTANYYFAPIVSLDNKQKKFVPNPENADNYYGYDLAASNGGTYQGLLNLSMPIINGGNFEAYTDQNNIGQQISENSEKLLEHDIEKNVTDQYLQCLLSKNQLAFSDSLIGLIHDQISVVGKLVESGYAKKSDLSLLKIELRNNEISREAYKAAYQKSVLNLKVYCGIRDTVIKSLHNIELDLTGKTDSSNFSRQYLLDSLNASAGQEVFESRYKPKLNFYSNAGLNAVYAPTAPKRFGFGAGLTFSWNLYDGNQRALQERKTEIQKETISSYKQNFLSQNEIRKYNLLKEIDTYTQRESISKEQLAEYERLLDLYAQQIINGEMSVINYITSLKNMVAAQRDYLNLKTNKLLLINAYNYWNW